MFSPNTKGASRMKEVPLPDIPKPPGVRCVSERLTYMDDRRPFTSR